jgi:ribose transport system substrate-binding protein
VGVINAYSVPDVPSTGKRYKAAVFVAQQQQGDAISYTQAMKEYGAQHGLDVDLYDAGSYANIDKQINQIQTALTTHPDIMIVWATDPNAVVPALTQAAEQGVKIMNWIVPSAYTDVVADIHTDFTRDAYNLTKTVGTMIGGKGKIVTAFGGCGGSYQRDLQAGADKAVSETPGLQIAVKECPSDFDPSKVQDIVGNALVAQPDIKGVLTSVVSQAVGAINAIQASGARGNVVVGSGILTSCDDVQLVKHGQVPVVAGVPSAYMGRLGAAVAIRALAGAPVDKTYVVPSNIYTAANINQADLTNDLTAQFLKGC